MNELIFTEISYGRTHSLAIDLNGEVYSWGDNGYGQLGDGTYFIRKTPVKVNILKNIIQIEAGDRFSLALEKDGSIWAWGDILVQYPIGDIKPNSTKPIKLKSFGSVKQIAAGRTHGFALLENGRVRIFGCEIFEEEKKKPTVNYDLTHWEIQNLTDIISIAAGDFHLLALRADGTVWSWGYNTFGQLGDGTSENQLDEASRVLSLYGVKKIIAGSDHNFAIKTNGEVWGWGDNLYGQISHNDKTEQRIPILVNVNEAIEIVQISAGYAHTLVRLENGRIVGLGDNKINPRASKNLNVYTGVSDFNKVIDVVARDGYSIITIEGETGSEILGCGFNMFAQFGNGTNENKEKFELIKEYKTITKTTGKIEDNEDLEF